MPTYSDLKAAPAARGRSLRARARERYLTQSRHISHAKACHAKVSPTKMRSLNNQRSRNNKGGGAQLVLAAAPPYAPPQKILTALTQKTRALYEDSVVPVRDIARLAGVTERTLYKYVQRGGWRRRYARRPLHKGAGGRFVSPAQASVPQPCGLGALDAAGAAKAAIGCDRAARASSRAVARAVASDRLLNEFAIRVRSLGLLAQALRALAVSPRRGGAL